MTAPTSTTSAPVESDAYRKLRLRVGGSLVFMAILHVILPKPFLKIIPKSLGAPRFWNLVAGAAEGTAGALLLSNDRAKHRAGGALATATFVGVYPANINMAIQAGKPTNPAAIAAWLRLPFQFPMIASGIKLAKGEGR
ncbi:MAG: DoxX family protein [Aquihabitans sp.]